MGSGDHHTLDLGVLQDHGVRLVGRAVGAESTRVELAQDLADSMAAADARLRRLLERIDGAIDRGDLATGVFPAEKPQSIRVPATPRSIDLTAAGIQTVLWATGYRRSYPWMEVPALDAQGEIRHEGGVTCEAGLYVLGLQFLRSRKSSLIDGVGKDAAHLSRHIALRLRATHRAAA